MTKVKICGITNLEDAGRAVQLGADMLGFNFYEKSPRYVSPGTVRNIIDKIGYKARAVGVFVNEENERLLQITIDAEVSLVQFHGDETEYALDLIRGNLGLEVIKALRVHDGLTQDPAHFGKASFLVDGCSPGRYGGTGTLADWETAPGVTFGGNVWTNTTASAIPSPFSPTTRPVMSAPWAHGLLIATKRSVLKRLFRQSLLILVHSPSVTKSVADLPAVIIRVSVRQ